MLLERGKVPATIRPRTPFQNGALRNDALASYKIAVYKIPAMKRS